MTETLEAPAAETPAPAKAEKAPRVTIARDAKVLQHLVDAGEAGVLREDVVAFLRGDEPDLSTSQVYLTLNRLKAAGKVERKFTGGKHRWSAVASA